MWVIAWWGAGKRLFLQPREQILKKKSSKGEPRSCTVGPVEAAISRGGGRKSLRSGGERTDKRFRKEKEEPGSLDGGLTFQAFILDRRRGGGKPSDHRKTQTKNGGGRKKIEGKGKWGHTVGK